MDDIPVLREYEVEVVANKLGEGGFCSVSAVHSITINTNIDSDDVDSYVDADADASVNVNVNVNVESSTFTASEKKMRQRFAKQFKNYKREHFTHRKIVVPQTPSLFKQSPPPLAGAGDPTIQRPPKLALKKLKSSLIYGTNKYRTGVQDLMAEISVLSKCRKHPNIIFLHAIGYNHQKEYDDDDDDDRRKTKRNRIITFAIIDQLKTTLKDRITRWKEDRKNLGISTMLSLSHSYRKKYNDLWLERMVVLFKVADAVSFLHSRGIIHRDINPNNIGFTEDNVVKLFDFGLAKELRWSVGYCNHNSSDDECRKDEEKEDYKGRDDNELFDLTSSTGTLRYMAPEIAAGGVSCKRVPYGFKVDVYSFALVMYEVLSLTKPYLHLVAENFDEEIVRCGKRPPLDDKTSWPLAIRTLLERMWNTDVAKRPCSNEIVSLLGGLLRGDDSDLYPDKNTVVKALKRQFVRK